MEGEKKKKEALSREMLAVLDRIELLVKQLVVAGSQAGLYAGDHPVVKEYTGKAYETVGDILRKKEQFSISVREDLLVYENIPLYRLSMNSRKFINLLEGRKIGGMTFHRGLLLDELVQFVEVLAELPEELESGEVAIRELERRGVKHIELLKPIKEEEEKKKVFTPKELYKESVRMMRKITRAITQGGSPNMEEVDSLVANISKALREGRNTLLAMTSIKNYDEAAFTHSINVCVFSTALASLFITEEERLNEIGKAAMLHDIGKILLHQKVADKQESLDHEEMKAVRRHPVDGARILEEMEGVATLAVIVAFEHHMGYDMSGYPRIEAIARPDPISLLVQVADVYDEMTSVRPYGKRSQPACAMAEMSSGAGTYFEPRLLKEFIGMMGIFPPGTAVELDTGEIGMVESVNKKNLLRPNVKILRGKDGEELEEDFVVDLDEKDERSGDYVRSVVRTLEAEAAGIDKLLYIKE